MKTIRLGNDVQINWYITRFGQPEDFNGKAITVQLIDKLGEPQVFDYEIVDNRITGIFYGKDQTTNGVYRLLLTENEGEDDMVTLDYIDAFTLSNKLKNQTSNGSDSTSTINTEVEEYTSQIDLEQDLFLYAKKTYVNEKIDEVNQRIDELPIANVYTKDEIDASFYNKQEVDQLIDDIELYDYYNKEEVDQLIDNVEQSIPTKTSDLTNDSGYINGTALATLFDGADYDSSTKRINFKHGQNILAYIDATAFIKDGMVESVVIEDGYVVITFNTDSGKEAIRIDITDIFDPSNYYDKNAVDNLLAGKQDIIIDLGQIRFDASSGAVAYSWGNHASAGYAKDASLATVAKSGSYNDLSDKPTIPTKVSDLTNDSSYITDSYATQNFEAKAWRGTQAEYDNLTVIEQNKLYIILPTT